jgi:hypothetical protein
MPAAATIEQAMADTYGAVFSRCADGTADMAQRLLDFLENAWNLLDAENPNHARVYNWRIPLQRIVNEMPYGNLVTTQWASDIFLAVYGATCAAKYAADDGDITAAMEAQFLVGWNVAIAL